MAGFFIFAVNSEHSHLFDGRQFDKLVAAILTPYNGQAGMTFVSTCSNVIVSRLKAGLMYSFRQWIVIVARFRLIPGGN